MDAKRADTASAGPARPGGEDAKDLEYLLGRVGAGDQAAFAAVYSRVAGPVFGLARTMAGDSGWSQEVAAGALTEVWRAAPQYDPTQASAQSWIMRIARQHVVSHLRAARTGKNHREGARLDQHRTGQPAPDTAITSGPVCGDERQAVLLALYGGYTREEISDRLGLTRETTARLIRDGLGQARGA